VPAFQSRRGMPEPALFPAVIVFEDENTLHATKPQKPGVAEIRPTS
jgi:hypothetical protein